MENEAYCIYGERSVKTTGRKPQSPVPPLVWIVCVVTDKSYAGRYVNYVSNENQAVLRNPATKMVYDTNPTHAGRNYTQYFYKKVPVYRDESDFMEKNEKEVNHVPTLNLNGQRT